MRLSRNYQATLFSSESLIDNIPSSRQHMPCEKFRIYNMPVPELPYKISFPEEALYCIRKITKLFEELRSHLNKAHEMMYNSMIAHHQNFKLQMQPQAVPISDLSLSKATPQKNLVSSD